MVCVQPSGERAVYGRVLFAVLAPSLFLLSVQSSSAQVACIRGPNGAVVCGPPAQQSGSLGQRGTRREMDYRQPGPRFANRERLALPRDGRFPRERMDDRSRSRPDLQRAPQESELERARAARRFYSERLREAMLHEQELQQGGHVPQERLGPADRRRSAGAAPGYAPPRYSDRAPPRYREDRREPFPPRNAQRYPGQERMGRTQLSEREPMP